MIGVRLLALAALVACAHAVNETILNTSTLKARVEDDATGGLAITLDRDGTTEVVALVGLTLGTPTSVVSDNNIVITYSAADTTLTIQTAEITGKHTGQTISLTWDAPKNVVLQDCVSYGFHQWYGGPQQKQQYWPIQLLNLTRYSYVTKEADNCGVAERYWLNSAGIFYYFDKRVPLFFDSNNLLSNGACFLASVQSPYSNKRARNNLVYVIAVLDDVRKAHEYAVATYLNKPSGYPDELMIKYPIWSTWARYKRDVSHELVLQFADEITSYGFPNSQFELDDLWEICYGSLTVNTTRFPSMKDTIDKLRQRGYRTTMWAHPFMNKGCDPWYTNAKDLGYIVSSETGNVETSWWNDNGTTAAYVDFTKQTVRDWYMQRLHRLQNETGVDAYKFDGGETSWSPTVAVLQGDVNEQPNSITADYVRTVSAFGPLVEVRVGFMTQDLPIFVRMIDKDTYWTFDNGLPTLITTLFQMNINGYPLVLPDMIGGNGYNEPPSKELFIRWLQANTFMPSLQFSYVPWDYDNETIAISKKFVQLHADYTQTIIEACKKAVSEGKPVNMPIWWIAPTDTIAHAIWDGMYSYRIFTYVDFTKQTVRDWYMQRLHRLQNETGVDAYKFDGGETSWSPTVAVLQGDVNEQPNSITADYVRTVAAFGPLVEVRVGFMTQDLPIFVRMIDKDTYWTFDNGLPTLITTLFQMNINGYPLVLPDMIGGNGYNEPPSKELFIRWLQANTFMPSLQFSYVPWDYDNETIAISKKFVQLHADYTPTIIEACKKAVSEGKPVNMPIWWIAPTDTIAHAIWDEYLLGESILVAPIVTQNARSRDIYLPKGTWYDQGNKSKVIEGPTTLTNYSAPLDVLPFFVRAGSTAPFCSVVLVLLGVFTNVLSNC
ncbi:hypothetical protein B5X24_HaOG206800 [Helicoverpa armigera]|uniref:Myogenesis-regulating glycosidase-like n=1 Tax=Helicoverpa armigera TaxID=29058 RepID=A0A2W1BJ10_HELAM|nr:hypothetical protein B5X24_HaOG206800 [Helicoverpa armigera]